jgi:putative ABC transport system permease protein
MAMKSVLLHKLRSGLTILGIVFGVFSVIAMLAIGEGASAQAQKQVLELGATNIIVRSTKPPEDTSQSSGSSRSYVLKYGLLRADYNLLKDSVPTITSAIPIREISQEVRFKHRTMNNRIVGCTSEYAELNHLNLTRGRFISEVDQEKAANVAVLAWETAQTLFPYEDPLGEKVIIGTHPYLIIGLTAPKTSTAAIGGSMSGQEYNKDIYVPLRTLNMLAGEVIYRRTAGSRSAEQVELNQITLKVESKDDVLATSQVVAETLIRNHKVKDYDIIVPLELLKQADQIRYIFNFVLGSIAAISLVVGGIGIMNIMLATVTERTREIGIRRALGAKRKDIIEQFLTETIVLSGTGGIIGVILGLLTPYSFQGLKWVTEQVFLKGASSQSDVAKLFLDMEPTIAWWSLPVAFGISVGIGVIFGVYPARSAAQLDPIEALRHE